MTGDLIGIRFETKTIFVHQNLLKSVTDIFDDARLDFGGIVEHTESVGIPEFDIETFRRFVTWLYSHDRGQYMRLHAADALLPLYFLACSMKSVTLRIDVLWVLSYMISLVSHCPSQ